ncbi:hypothetical protein WJU16_03800 [Chitinophaga pollutisoli]|uniref:Homogentisate 1,2-dioxygenase n=1 Tax=Chitinophaga pollutisoli TaxID=3133966 RepID=A0ABZ2YQT2_9BACT
MTTSLTTKSPTTNNFTPEQAIADNHAFRNQSNTGMPVAQYRPLQPFSPPSDFTKSTFKSSGSPHFHTM